MWIALLYGLGVGLTFDEFGMWLNPPFVRGVRWNTNGIALVLMVLALIGLLPAIRRTSPLSTEQVDQTRAQNNQPASPDAAPSLQRFPNPSI
jgi:hypothetical protein